MEGILEGGSRRVTDPLDRVRKALRARARTTSATPEGLSDGIITGLVGGTLDAARREAALPHLASCARCRGAVASVARALGDAAVARELAALEGGRFSRGYRILLPLAAAAVLVVVLTWPRLPQDGGHRGPPPVASAPAPIAPVGIVASVSPFQWSAVAGADRYRLTLSDASGRVRYETQVTDTVATLPDSIALTPGRSYVWLVSARTGFDRWTTSQLAEFSIAGAPPP